MGSKVGLNTRGGGRRATHIIIHNIEEERQAG